MLLQASARQLPIRNDSVHLIISSPPYNASKNYSDYKDCIPWPDYWNLISDFLKESYRVLVPGGRIAVNLPNLVQDTPKREGSNLLLPEFPRLCSLSGFKLRDLIVWVKARSEQKEHAEVSTAWGSWNSPSNPFLRSSHEFILLAHKGDGSRKSDQKSDLQKEEFLSWTRSIWFLKPSPETSYHPAVFPMELPFRLIKLFSFPGDVVCDTFMGSGTVAVACKSLNRKFIGTDISMKYCRMAKERSSQDWLQLS